MARGTRAVLLVLTVATAGCLMTADPSRYADGPVIDSTAPDGRPDAPTPDPPPVDAPAPDGPSPADGPPHDLGAPDTLATYHRTWVTVTVAAKPAKLWSPKAVYVGSTGTVLLYGGTDPTQAAVADAWTYDGSTWTKVCGPCAPGPRVGHGMVWDAKRDVVVLFGGKDTALMNDVWELKGGVWTQVSPTGTGPTPRWGAFVAYDPVRDRTVVFGGYTGVNMRMDDLFEYDGTSWHGPFLPALRPTGRVSYASSATFAGSQALVAAVRNRVVIFGGETAPKVTADDCWAWDGAVWTPLCAACTQTARTGATLGFDPATGRLVLANGWTGADEIAGTFEQHSAAWLPTTSLPPKRDHATMTFDSKRNRFVLFGGNGDSCNGNCDDTLEYVAP